MIFQSHTLIPALRIRRVTFVRFQSTHKPHSRWIQINMARHRSPLDSALHNTALIASKAA